MKPTLFLIFSLFSPLLITAQEGRAIPRGRNVMYETPSSVEINDLQFLREEELLAGDVYKYFYTLYPLPFFRNIPKSEDAHTASIEFLLDKYSLPDPGKFHKAGVFKSPELEKLYNDLIKKGSASIIEALTVSALIEEMDIYDLKEAMGRVKNNDDILFVYSNLRRASGNHLRVFTRHLTARGVNYSPSYLSDEEYRGIVE